MKWRLDIFRFDNGNVAVCDENGKQVNRYLVKSKGLYLVVSKNIYLSDNVCAILGKMISKNPDDRYQKADDKDCQGTDQRRN